MLKIGYLTLDNPHNIKCFSGTGFYMYRALEHQENIDLLLLGERYLKRKSFLSIFFHYLKRITKPFLVVHDKVERLEFIMFSRQVLNEVKKHKFNFIVAPVCSSLIAKVGSYPQIPPIIFITDATPGFLKEFYQWDIKSKSIQDEIDAIDNSAIVVYSSNFMAKRAIQEYDAYIKSNEKFKVVPFGLNLDDIPTSIAIKSYAGKLNLLFVGRDWERKGGKVVLSTFKLLRESGISTKLTLIGCNPKEAQFIDGVEIIPYIDKSDTVQKRSYLQILNETHFLLLPTKADCTPMVIAEANAFGTPVLSSNVGGIPTLIENSKNGFLLDVEAGAETYSNLIISIISDNEYFKTLSKNSRKRFDLLLNWDAWCESIISIGNDIKKL